MTTANGLMKITATLIATGAKFNTQMQEHICNILAFANGEGSGNVTPATDLIQRLSRKADKQAITNWFQRHGGLLWKNAVEAKGKTKAKPEGFQKNKTLKDFVFNLEAAKGDNWFAEREQAAANAANGPRTTKYDLPKRINSILEALEDVVTEKVEGDNIPDFLVKGLTQLMREYEIYAKGQEAMANEAAKEQANAPAEIVKAPEAPKAEKPAKVAKTETPAVSKRRTSGNKERERQEREQVAA